MNYSFIICNVVSFYMFFLGWYRISLSPTHNCGDNFLQGVHNGTQAFSETCLRLFKVGPRYLPVVFGLFKPHWPGSGDRDPICKVHHRQGQQNLWADCYPKCGQCKTSARAAYTPAEGDSYILEITEKGVVQISSGKVKAYSNNKFTLTASNNVIEVNTINEALNYFGMGKLDDFRKAHGDTNIGKHVWLPTGVLYTARLSGGVLGFFVPLFSGLFIAGNGGAIKDGVLLYDIFSHCRSHALLSQSFVFRFW